jgi:hypothetical protein
MAEVIEADSLADWNDDPRRTQAEVVHAVQRAEDGFDPPHPEGAWFEPN